MPSKTPGSPAPILIELRCGCGGMLNIDVAPEWVSELDTLVQLARAWNDAHRAHHHEPKATGS
jgi:hypothetical protein